MSIGGGPNLNGHSQMSLSSAQLPPVPPIAGQGLRTSSPPAPSIDTAFFNVGRQYPDQNRDLLSQQQQQQALPPDMFVVPKRSKRYPNGHSRSVSTSTTASQVQPPTQSPTVNVKVEPTGTTHVSNAGLFSGGARLMSWCVSFSVCLLLNSFLLYFLFSFLNSCSLAFFTLRPWWR